MRICVLSDDDFFARLLALECAAFPASVCRGKRADIPAADLYLCDLETGSPPSGECITFGEGGDFPRAYSARALAAALAARIFSESPKPRLTLFQKRRSALFDGQEIFFSRREFALLSALYEAEGFLARGELIDKVWDGAADERTVNVYIHYLREKLESGGRRLIYSDRTQGYALYKEGRDAEADLR